MYICCLTLCVREPVTHGRPVCRSYYVTLPPPLPTVSPYPHHCHISLTNRSTSRRCTQLASYGQTCFKIHRTQTSAITSATVWKLCPTLRLSLQNYRLDYRKPGCLGERGSVGWRQRRNSHHTCRFIFITGNSLDFCSCFK